MTRVLDAIAGHQFGEAVIVDLGGRKGADLAPVAQHGHALGDLDDLLEPMADEDDGDARAPSGGAPLQAADRPRAGSATRSARP